MKSFFWKFILCLVPCALAAWVSVDAIAKYREGTPGGFKFGVDLVGGTILVYEIDVQKNRDVDKQFDASKDINVLAESLWENTLFNDSQAWQKLLKNTTEYWAELDTDKIKKELALLPVGKLKSFEDFIFKSLIAADVQPSDKTIDLWVKKQAWDEML